MSWGTVLDKIQELYSASFLLGYLVPVMLIAGVNATIFPLGLGISPTFKSPLDDIYGGNFAFTALGLVVAAYVLAPLIPVFRAILEGRLLIPRWLRRLGARRWSVAKEGLRSETNAAKDRFAQLESQRSSILAELSKAREAGNNLVSSAYNPTAIEEASKAISDLEAQLLVQSVPAEEKLSQSTAALAEALQSNRVKDAGDPSLANAETMAALRDLDKLHERMRNNLNSVADLARLRAGELSYRFRSQFGSQVEPTLLGNARAAMERYPAIAYGVEFDFIWPRLQRVLSDANNAAIKAMVDAATAKRDAAVLLTMLSAATVLVWLPVLALIGKSFWVLVAVGLFGPLAVVFFYNLLAETEKAFGEVLAATVDALRLKLLDELKQPTPDTLGAERKTWDKLQRALYAQGGIDLRYRQ